ncbi:unnamed protein product [Arctia plantaginis]|uniref:Uncharacterized protein n=1 Tax=Arctia plantaginis TaxID=874455 RepID=A0A8S1ACZ2_ARCPL|nr:unnamed protein product [Arctia plantaginis]
MAALTSVVTKLRARIKVMVKRWHRSRRNLVICSLIIFICIAYYIALYDNIPREANLDITRSATKIINLGETAHPTSAPASTYNVKKRPSVLKYIESTLAEALKQDKGTGCNIPQLDPFAKEVTQFDKILPDVKCKGKDWVKCYHSECKVVPEILATTKDISCSYYDIIYESDMVHHLGPATLILNDDTYVLTKSDHVKISCTGTQSSSVLSSKWIGYATGFRTTVERKPLLPEREDALNVLIFGFDSTSKNGFIRRMPKSYKYLTEEMKATILNGYNIVGDGTPAALFPILTGKNELELPDVRKKMKNQGTLDVMPFLFYKLRDMGYRTAYFEDMPWIGTFQYRFNGFKHQPADHYLRAFYLEESKTSKFRIREGNKYCIGDTPQFQLMLNITDQFLRLDGKKFIFTFIADITHDNFNMISTADNATVNLLKTLVERRVLEDTLVMIMGDHGPRYANVRDTLQGKLEERLPLMGVLLPEKLKRKRPNIQAVLEENANALTTPHDIHATVLDVLDMKEHNNPYKVEGADLPRGLTLLEPIPRNRSCSEAGIEPHWCACLNWHNVSETEPIYRKAVDAFIDYINSLTEEVRSECIVRTWTETKWVMRQVANKRVLLFAGAKDADGYVGNFNAKVKYESENYQIKVVVGPGRGVYEASMKYLIKEDKFIINTRDISRTNAYGEEPSCISAKLPILNPYCYCKEYIVKN